MDDPQQRSRFVTEHLAELAAEVRALGLSAVVDAERRPFPGLTVAGTAGCAVVVVGTLQYWWQVNPPQPIGALGDPAGTARAIAASLEANR